MATYVLRAVVGEWAVRDELGLALERDLLPLSERLVVAICDWCEFFDEIGGDLSDSVVTHEFLGQGYKIAYGLRRELKGRTIHFSHPVTGELIEIG